MKSFRLFIPKPSVPLADGAEGDYSPEEIDLLRERFRPLASKYRRCQRVCVELLWLFLIAGICWMMLQVQMAAYFVMGSILAAIALGLFMILCVKLHCPGCGKDLEKELGRYCPECGHPDGVQPAVWFRSAKCEICGMGLRYHKGERAFKIRACTHCGLPLDDEGI